jgi:hypothetical protein
MRSSGSGKDPEPEGSAMSTRAQLLAMPIARFIAAWLG